MAPFPRFRSHLGRKRNADACLGMAVGIAGLGWVAAPSQAQESFPSFEKRLLNPEFYSEGIHFGDLDRDGHADIIAGPYWYPGPAFTGKRAFRTPRATPFPISGDSDCYAIFPYDFDGDGWLDILSFRNPGGAEAVWYENPADSAALVAGVSWAEHVVFSRIENESAALIDITGDGKPEIIANSAGYGGWAQPDWQYPERGWTFQTVTGRQSWGAFTHGIGAGDVNGDGRLDLLFHNGWWEQPADSGTALWTYHAAIFGGQENPGEALGGAQMYAYDVDGDGDNDVITSHQAHGWGLAWHENRGESISFATHLIMNTPEDGDTPGVAFSQLHALALADLDGDGLLDLVTGKRKGAHGNGLGDDLNAPAVLYAFRLTRPPGELPRYIPYLLDSEAGIGTQVTVGDVNGDGAPDILTTRRAGTFLFLNQAAFPNALARPPRAARPHRNGPEAPPDAAQAQKPSRFSPFLWMEDLWNALGRRMGR